MYTLNKFTPIADVKVMTPQQPVHLKPIREAPRLLTQNCPDVWCDHILNRMSQKQRKDMKNVGNLATRN